MLRDYKDQPYYTDFKELQELTNSPLKVDKKFIYWQKRLLIDHVFEGLFHLLVSQSVDEGVQHRATEVLRIATPFVNDAFSLAED